ncbi:MAG TPA: hypothetical protein VMR75_02230 [Candidatus Saccharimonadales bacterium]|nr:hypothetical protein [Candidatus Saccharimonadales bacterium]
MISPLGPDQIAALAGLGTEPDSHVLSAGVFPTGLCEELARIGVIEKPLQSTHLTARGAVLVRWLADELPAGREKRLRTLEERKMFFKQVALTSPRVRGLLLLLHQPSRFPGSISTAQEVRDTVVLTLRRCGAVNNLNGPTALSSSGNAVATWFSPSIE